MLRNSVTALDRQRKLLGSLHDAARDRMLGLRLERSRKPQHLVIVCVGQRHHVGDAEAALGQGAGLVEHHCTQLAPALEGGAVADQQAASGRQRGAHRHHQRHREPQRVRAGDHHHRDHPLDREGETAVGEEPYRQRKQARTEGDEGEPQRGAVGQVLRARARGLGLAHHLDHLGQVGVLSGLGDLHDDRTLAVDGAADDGLARAARHRLGLAGEHRLVEAGACPRRSARPWARARRA